MEREKDFLKEIEKVSRQIKKGEEPSFFQDIIDEKEKVKWKFFFLKFHLVIRTAEKIPFVRTFTMFEDLISAGTLGLLKGIEGWLQNKPSGTSPPDQYLIFWIKRYILNERAFQNAHLHIPRHVFSKLLKANKIQNDFLKEGKLLQDEELRKLLRISKKQFKNLKWVLGTNPFSPSYFPTSEIEESEILEKIISERECPEEENIISFVLDLIEEILTEEERKVLILRFGFDDIRGRTKSFGKISKELNLPPELVRNILERALEKMRNAIMGNQEILSKNEVIHELT